MTNIIENLAAIMRAELKTLDAIAQNSANVNTNGFRSIKATLAESSFKNSLLSPSGNVSNKMSLDRRDGTAISTGSAFDLSVFGDGWFSIAHPSGIQLTRDGHFHIDNSGLLVNRHGYPVLGVSGEITGFDDAARIDAIGEITFSDGSKDQLQIFTTNNRGALTATGEGLYHAKQYEKAINYRVIQGSLESSNVDVAADMVTLIQTTRHMETLQRAMSSYDQILDIGINQIGK